MAIIQERARKDCARGKTQGLEVCQGGRARISEKKVNQRIKRFLRQAWESKGGFKKESRTRVRKGETDFKKGRGVPEAEKRLMDKRKERDAQNRGALDLEKRGGGLLSGKQSPVERPKGGGEG